MYPVHLPAEVSARCQPCVTIAAFRPFCRCPAETTGQKIEDRHNAGYDDERNFPAEPEGGQGYRGDEGKGRGACDGLQNDGGELRA